MEDSHGQTAEYQISSTTKKPCHERETAPTFEPGESLNPEALNLAKPTLGAAHFAPPVRIMSIVGSRVVCVTHFARWREKGTKEDCGGNVVGDFSGRNVFAQLTKIVIRGVGCVSALKPSAVCGEWWALVICDKKWNFDALSTWILVRGDVHEMQWMKMSA